MHLVSHEELVLSCYLVVFCLQWCCTFSWMLLHKEVKHSEVTRSLQLTQSSMNYSYFFLVFTQHHCDEETFILLGKGFQTKNCLKRVPVSHRERNIGAKLWKRRGRNTELPN